MTYLWLDQFFDWAAIWKDIYKRPFITAGFTAWLLMVPLALTSTAWSIRKLGGKRWQMLHRLIYVSALAGVIHLLLAGEVRHHTAAALWRDSTGVNALSGGFMAPPAKSRQTAPARLRSRVNWIGG